MSSLRWRIFLPVAILAIALGVYADRVMRTATDATGPRGLLAVGVLAAIMGGYVIAALAARHVAEPLRRITSLAERMSEGDLSPRVHDVPRGLLSRLSEALNTAAERLQAHLTGAHDQSRRYAAILEQMTDAVVAVDADGRVQFVNRSFARLFEVDAEDAGGRPLENVTLNYEASELVARALTQGQVQRAGLSLTHPRERLLEGVVTPLTEPGGAIVGAVGLFHDVTQSREVDRVRQDFVANASHELRTPAAGIKALAEALQAGAVEDPQRGRRFCEQIVEAADRLTEMLDDMLTLTRIERGAKMLEPELLAAADAVDEALAQVAPAARGRDVELAVEVDDGELYADAASLQTLLVNLLDNAVKYTPEGGRVTAVGRTVPGGYEVAVIDTGLGIAPEHQQRIFERFYRVDRARDRSTGSTGLGLSIVRHIADAHGGTVKVTSTPGEGSTFTAFFPAATDGEPEA